MNVVLVYATYSNSTFLAAEILANSLREKGHNVTPVLATDVTVPQVQQADLVILASPSWDIDGVQGLPHQHFDVFKKTLGNTQLPNKKCAIMGLGDSTYTFFCGAVTHLEKLIAELRGSLVIDSLKIDRFYFFEQERTQEIRTWAVDLASKL